MPESQPIDIEILQLKAGLRRVARKDRVPSAEADPLADGYRAQGFHVFVAEQPYDFDPETGEFKYNPSGEYCTVLAARERRDLFEAIGYLFLEIYPDEGQRSGMGGLLGYPECCIQEFRVRARLDDTARAVAALNNTAGVLNPLLDQFSPDRRFIAHFPCRYDCEPSVRMAEAAVKAVGKDLKPGDPDWKKAGLLFADGAHVLVQGEAAGMTIRYGGAQVHGNARDLLDLLRKGDRCEVEETGLRVFRGDVEKGDYSRNCGVFIFNWGGPNVYPAGHFNGYLDSLRVAEASEQSGWQAELRAVVERALESLKGGIRLESFYDLGKEVEMRFIAGAHKFRLNARPRGGGPSVGGYTSERFVIRKYIEDDERCKKTPALADAMSRLIDAVVLADRPAEPEPGKA